MSGAAVRDVDVSVVCWVGWGSHELEELHAAYGDLLAADGRTAEFLFILDGPGPHQEEMLGRLRPGRFPIRVYRMARRFGEAAGLQFGIERARGRLVLTVPDRFQADPSIVPELLKQLDAGDDLVTAARSRGKDALLNRLQFRLFNAIVRRLSGLDLDDVTSGLRAMSRKAATSLDLYGDLHLFAPILAARRGYRVTEIKAPQHPEDRALRLYGLGGYVRKILSVLSVFFVTRFLQTPLRFFGGVGVALAAAGMIVCVPLAVQRLLGETALANRPLLLLGVLLIVLGVQFVSLGLIGEIVIFLSSRREAPDVQEVLVERDDAAGATPPGAPAPGAGATGPTTYTSERPSFPR